MICMLLWQSLGGATVNGQRLANKPALQLSTSIVEEKYCRDGGESLRIHLSLRYQNAGTHKLILYKGSSLVSRYFVSRTVKAATRKHYVEVVRNEIVFPPEQESLDSASPGEAFAILESGKSFVAETEVDIPVRDKSDPHSGFLPPGRYVLEIVVSTWLQSPDLAKALESRWRKSGLLWYRPITSLPMPFAVHRERNPSRCE